MAASAYKQDGSVGLYEAVQAEGERELLRPLGSLWWSGVAAGICISASVLATAFLQMHLPDTVWAPLVSDMGYVVGFLIVVLGHLQLFTENTITTVLPLLASPSVDGLWRTGRLWAIVFLANLVGAAIIAVTLAHGGLLTPEQLEASVHVAHHATSGGAAHNLASAVPAGFLIAVLVWVLESAPNSKFMVVASLTYVIALGDFAHVVAGSVEVGLIVATEGVAALGLVGTFVLPALIGNIIGGTFLFALLAYAQVREELDE